MINTDGQKMQNINQEEARHSLPPLTTQNFSENILSK